MTAAEKDLGIPRGSFVMMAPILLAVGLPVEGVGMLIAVDAIPDTLATVLETTGNPAATAIVSRRTAADASSPA